MLDTVHLVATLLLVGVFALSGVTKLRDPQGTVASIKAFAFLPVPEAGRRAVARALPVLELLLALALLFTPGVGFVVVGTCAVLAMLGFTAIVAISLSRGEAASCHCFGELSAAPMTRWTLVRNVVFVVLAVFVAYGAGTFDGVVAAFGHRSAWQLAWVVTVLVFAAALVVLWFAWSATKTELAEIEDELARQRCAFEDAQSGEDRPIPDVTVLSEDGSMVRLAELSSERAQLMMVVSPGCSNCEAIVPVLPAILGAFNGQVEIALLTIGDLTRTRSKYGDGGVADIPMYGDVDGRAQQALGVYGTPGAVLLGTDGNVTAGPAHGAEEINELIAAVVQAIGVNMVTGAAHPLTTAQRDEQEQINRNSLPDDGSEIADTLVEFEDGTRMPLRDAVARIGGGEAIPVVAWRHDCPYCGEIAAAMKEPSANGSVVLLVNEPISTVRAQGLTGPALTTVDIDCSQALGVPGTPAGYPLKDGVKLPGGGVGGPHVIEMFGFTVLDDGRIFKADDVPGLVASTVAGPDDSEATDIR